MKINKLENKLYDQRQIFIESVEQEPPIGLNKMD